MDVRDATAADVPAMLAVYAPYIETTLTFELDVPDPATYANRIAPLLDGGHPCLVAEHDGRIVGFAYAGPYRPRGAYRHTAEHSIYVDRDHRRQGTGRRLMERLLDRCVARQIDQLLACVADPEVNLPTMAFHARFGFRTVGRLERVGFKHDRWLDVVLLQRGLNDTGDAENVAGAG